MTDPPDLPDDALTTLLDDVRDSAARLRTTLGDLTDVQAREPSTLHGWSRGHVITHIARSAEVYRWLLAWARTGTEPGPRADAATLDRALRDGAEREATELVADIGRSLDRLLDEAAAVPRDRWATLVTALAGWRHPAWYTLHRARRELETHHADLNLGYTTADWPVSYVTWAINETVAALVTRDFPLARIEATDLNRSWTLTAAGPAAIGSAHAILSWLSGREQDPPLLSGLQLPPPPTWPLPPAPGRK